MPGEAIYQTFALVIVAVWQLPQIRLFLRPTYLTQILVRISKYIADKSFWSDLDQARPAKRQKLDQPSDNMESFNLNESHLSQYYSHVHPLIGLLPEAGTVIGVIENATVKVSHAFAIALELLPGIPSESTVNGDHHPESTAVAQTSVTAPRPHLSLEPSQPSMSFRSGFLPNSRIILPTVQMMIIWRSSGRVF